MPAKCSAITRAGRPCPSPPLAGSAWCWTHDPNAAGARVEASRKGGHARSNAERARKEIPAALTAAELQGYLAGALTGVLAGTYSPGQANAVAALSRAIVTVREAGELEERIEELERAAGTSPKGWTA